MSKDNQQRDISQVIVDFIECHIKEGLIHPLNKHYATNQLLAVLNKTDMEVVSPSKALRPPLALLDQMVDYAVHAKVIDDSVSARDVLEAKLMDSMTPSPYEVNRQFWEAYQTSPYKATDLFYTLSKQTNYIKTREISKNIAYLYPSDYGDLQITINLSKPEKNPKEIAQAKRTKQSNYPLCVLCMENEGYEGHLSHPGRTNHRIVRMKVSGEEWGFQYSPYSYYNEHAIFLSGKHREMKVDLQAIQNLLDILVTLPHYFVGSNADLPIVGGSILSHDHYQGGRHTFPLDLAEKECTFQLDGLPEVEASLMKWPMSVIRISSEHKEALVEAADRVMTKWKTYTDQSVGIYAESEGIPHNAITPIARRRGDAFEIDMVLRNNRTSPKYPDGIFHPHPSVQHIKKENIGLIEVMGLAILPPRLKEELEVIKAFLLDRESHVAPYHQEWANELKAMNTVSEENVSQVVDEAVGSVFLKVLEHAGVFKRDAEGKKAFRRFAEYVKQA
ncbi:Galactose-1-phosphate uridylyltransferase [Alkalibacterium sp. AK22]|uniref:UDP-glucose--hexose-1-phosphate uridylyltransferase n=1 Tax=Alkalibacterium sp. AK22 TaxID=1229520 RepID=UPI00044DF8F0|nr:UDP-glucose--hexose-1-phosphate uridylyltransferase [Alkalibacterium sp. AK22]EXJ23334.1 Galactose-1-phosphate uridylyltransferase [Alkalibacterium sp. AK22]